MRKITLAAVSAAMLAAAPTMAADLRVPVRAPAQVVAQAFNWSGFYIGAHGGYGWGKKDWHFPDSDLSTRHEADGGFAGGQIGFNWQTGNFVFGVEGEGSWADITGVSVCPNAAFDCRTKIDWLASITGRAGLAFDNWLLYVKGGYAWAGERFKGVHVTNAAFDTHSDDITRDGWTLGGGIEVGFWNNWSAKVEYMYTDFGRRSFDFHNAGVVVDEARIKQELHTVKLGVNYRFGWGGPGRF